MGEQASSAEKPEQPKPFRPSSIFDQTCGHCGAVFRVEVARQTDKGDLAEYCCPACNHHVCRVNSSSAPRVKLLSNHRKPRPR